MPAYGKVKVDTITYDLSGTATDVSVSNIATKASPTFTGTVTIPTATAGDNSTKAASTAFVVASFATKASPTFTGTINAADLVLSGDLTVNGSTTTIDTTTLQVEDKNIQIGKVSTPSDVTADGGGLTLLGSTNKTWNWVNSTDAWTSSEHIHLGDDKKLLIGTGSDLEVYHDASNTYLLNNTGDLILDNDQTNSNNVIVKAKAEFIAYVNNGANFGIRCENTGASTLYHSGNPKLATSSTGVSVTGTVTATSFSGSGANLTNLPPGGNSIELVADGAIAAGKPVILKTNGKAEQVKETLTVLSPPTRDPAFSSSGTSFNYNNVQRINSSQVGVAWSETTKIGSIVFADDHDSDKLTTRGFRLSTTFGYDGNYYQPNGQRTLDTNSVTDAHVCWDSTNNKFCYAYRRASDHYTYFTHASPDTSNAAYITDPGTVHEVYGETSYLPRICDAGSGRIAVCLHEDTSTKVRMISWNGSSDYTMGTTNTVQAGASGANADMNDICYHASEAKLVAVYRDTNNSNVGGCKIGTISGSGGSLATSWGSEVQFDTNNPVGMRVAVDENSGSVVIVYKRTSGTNTEKFHIVAGTISGTSISFGTPTVMVAINGYNTNYFPPAISYVPGLQECAVSIVVNNGGVNQRVYTPSTSGTTVTVGGDIDLMTIHSGTENALRYMDMVPITKTDGSSDPETQLILVGKNEHDGNKGIMRRLKYTTAVTNLTNQHQNFLGFAEDAISDGATGTIKLSGNVVGNQSGLTPATWYYVVNDGTLTSGGGTYLAGGMAVAADKLRINDIPKN